MQRRRFLGIAASAGALGAFTAAPVLRAENGAALTVLSPAELQESGLLDVLLGRFRQRGGMTVRLVTDDGDALEKRLAVGGDLLLAYDREGAERLEKQGHVTDLRELFYTELVVVGPSRDPAGVAGMASVIEAFARIAAGQHRFVSRADRSFVHRTELALWEEAAFDPEVGAGNWYIKSRRKMSLTVKLAALEEAYTLAGLPSWLRFGDSGRQALLVSGDPRLQVPVVAMRLDPARYPQARQEPAIALLRWLGSEEAQAAIGEFAIGGQPVYYLPNDERD